MVEKEANIESEIETDIKSMRYREIEFEWDRDRYREYDWEKNIVSEIETNIENMGEI